MRRLAFLALAALAPACGPTLPRGTVTLDAFGGKISCSDVTVSDLAKPYANLHFKAGAIERIHLMDLGQTFRFGLLSGVLDGRIEDLRFTGGELTQFKLDLETVRVRGVPQFVNRRAIESIQRVLAGPLGVIEESLFGRFAFSEFGFTCGLKNDVFELAGKYRDGDTEYIMRGEWYQVPRINIINARPGKKYDWKTIVTTLRGIYEEP